MKRAPRIVISAGEASGDRLGAGLARALRERCPDVELVGMGGEEMQSAGVRLIQDSSEVAVVGLSEVLFHLRAIRRAMLKLRSCLQEGPTDLLVPIDFPEFNLRLSRRAQRAGIPVVYFVSPQIWAWRAGRLRSIGEVVRRMLVLFPFESALYEKAGIPVTFVGHPVMEALQEPPGREELCSRAGLDPGRTVIALLPGSRKIEITRLLPVMLEAAARIKQARPEVQFLVQKAPGLEEAWFGDQVHSTGLEEIHIHGGDFPEILTVCSAGVVASGTASLEAAVAGLPMVVVYKVGLVSNLLGRFLMRLENISLPNLVAGRRLVPELLQGEFTAPRVAEVLLGYLDNPQEAARIRQDLRDLARLLGEPGIYDRAAEAVLGELNGEESSRPR